MEQLFIESLLKVPEVACWLRLSDQVVKRMAKEGQIPGIRVGKSWRFNREQLAKWLDANPRTGSIF
jgi:excisionase family DNA binding protein